MNEVKRKMVVRAELRYVELYYYLGWVFEDGVDNVQANMTNDKNAMYVTHGVCGVNANN